MGPVDIEHQPAITIDADRVADELTAGLFDPNPSSERRRVLAQFVADPIGVGQPGRQPGERGGEDLIAADPRPDFVERSCALDPRCGDVEPHPDDNGVGRARHELGEHAGELADGFPVLDHQVVRPLERSGSTEARHRGPRRCCDRSCDPRRHSPVDRQPQTHHQLTLTIVVPRPIEAPPACGLMLGGQHRSRPIAGSGFGDQVGVRRAGG